MARLFVAVWPPAALVDALEGLARPTVAGVRWTTAAQWHVTLRFFGEADVEEAAAALSTISCRPAIAVVGRRARRLGPSAFVVPVPGLGEVAAAVAEATSAVGRPPEDRPFHGHLTLARIKDRARPVLPKIELTPYEWTVDEVTLVRSTPGPDGSRYDVVQRVALTI